MCERLRGLIAAVPTPLHPDGSLNLESVAPMAAMLSRGGASGVFVCGTTGESLSLTTEERMRLAAEWSQWSPSGLKVVVHVGHNSLPASQELARHAGSLHVSAIAAMPPVFFRPATIDGLADYCGRIADAAPNLPFYYYHLPAMTGVNFAMINFLGAAVERIPTLAGVKFTSNDLMDYKLCLDFMDCRFDLLFGRDEILLAGLAMGGRGAVGSSYSLMPRLYLQLIDALECGDIETSRRLQRTAIDLLRIMMTPPRSLIPSLKVAMGLCGIECGPARPPFPNLDATERKHLTDDLLAAGLSRYMERNEG